LTQFVLLLARLAVGFLFITINHPLAIGLILLCQTLLISLITGLWASSFWFSYILFLVFLGGMLVLFIYVTSLASNEIFSISSTTLIGLLRFIFVWGSISLLNDPLNWLGPNASDQLCEHSLIFNQEISNLLIKLYSTPTHLLTLLLVIYLFLTLIAVVTITNIFDGPLRSKY
jgi:NADH-ubiquinone oxidoreductase chain 6